MIFPALSIVRLIKSLFIIWGGKEWYTYDVSFEKRWVVRQKWDVIGRRKRGVSKCSGRPVFIFFNKENWICAMTRHHAEPNNTLLTRYLPFDSDVRQWSHPLMIPLHCLYPNWNNRILGQFECDVTWFCFCFDFVCSYARYSCCFIVCLRFEVAQMKQVDCKMSTKNVNNYK